MPERKPLTVLITGFGPFPGARFNPTEMLVNKLVHRRRPALAGLRLVGHVFHTSYAAVDRELPRLIAQHRPDALMMFGLASRTRYLRLEMHARRRQSVLFADASGRFPTIPVETGARSAIPGRAPFAQLLVAARAGGIPVRLSRDAGRYLCNYLYRRALEIPEKHRPRVTVFIHVPKVRPHPVPRKRLRRRSASPAGLVRIGEALLLVVATAARAC